MFDTTWDIEKYKTPYESDEHWELKRKFMTTHKETLPEDELVCMAQVFANIEFLGCRYPNETMARVAELAKGVVEDFREKKKNTLKRTFVTASDAANSKVKGRKCEYWKRMIFILCNCFLF